jgi:hypothetical protein
MAVRLSALRADRPLSLGRFLVLISARGWSDPGAIVRLERLGQLKIQWPHRDSNPRPFFYWNWGRWIPYRMSTAAIYWPIVPVPGDCEDGEVGGMKCGWQGKPKYSKKTCPGAILCNTNPSCQTRAQTRAAAVGSQRLTAWAMARRNPRPYGL